MSLGLWGPMQLGVCSNVDFHKNVMG